VIENTPEILTLSNIYEVLKGLDKPQLKRIFHWVKDKFDIQDGTIYFDPPPSGLVQIDMNPIPVVEIEQNPEEALPKKKGLDDYDMVLDLLTESKANKTTQKILLIAAFLQVRFKYTEISSHDISFRLKRMGHEVKNLMIPLSEILKKKPPLMFEVPQDQFVKTKKKFIVTNRGLKVAASYLIDPDEEKKPRKKREKKVKIEKKEKKERKNKNKTIETAEIKVKKIRGPRGPYKKRTASPES
jgi:hypothetical protein